MRPPRYRFEKRCARWLSVSSPHQENPMPIRLAALIAALYLVSHAALAADDSADAARPLPKIKIVLVGDSTVNDNQGWGPGFKKLLRPEAACANLAQNGRSSK